MNLQSARGGQRHCTACKPRCAEGQGGAGRRAARGRHALDSLHVEADCGDRGDNLAKLELVEDGGLASGVQTDLRTGQGGRLAASARYGMREGARRVAGPERRSHRRGDENARGSWGERFSRRAVGARTMRMRISCLPTRRPRAFAKTPPMVASGVCGVVLCAALGCLRGGDSGRVVLGRLASERVILKNVMNCWHSKPHKPISPHDGPS